MNKTKQKRINPLWITIIFTLLSLTLITTSEAVDEPNISVSPNTYDFGAVNIGEEPLEKNFAISNTGDLELTINAITITGTNADDFQIQSNPCSENPIAPASEMCMVEVIFSPKTEGSKSANLEINSNDPDDSPLNIPLTGIATKEVTTDTPNILITPASGDFGLVGVNTNSLLHSFQITNTGDTDLITAKISLTGSNADEFNIQSPDCSWQLLAPSESCTMNLFFSPLSRGDKNAILEIPSNASDEPTQIPLSGMGIEVWKVCASGCEYSKIQPAIDAASNGDTILVGRGTYSENIDFKGKFLTLTVQKESGGDTWDINGDGKIGLEEAIYILRVLVGAIP